MTDSLNLMSHLLCLEAAFFRYCTCIRVSRKLGINKHTQQNVYDVVNDVL